MLFTEPLFFAFFALVFIVHWRLAGNRARKRWLLVASYVFYAAWDWRFLALFFASTGIDFAAALGMERARRVAQRRYWLYLTLAGNLGLLGSSSTTTSSSSLRARSSSGWALAACAPST